MSLGTPHGGGVADIVYQAGAWNAANNQLFDLNTDGDTKFSEGNGGTPDLAISIPKIYSQNGSEPHKGMILLRIFLFPYFVLSHSSLVVIVELEVGNRSIPVMRRVFKTYFTDPELVSVVGIKMFGDDCEYLLCNPSS